MKALLFPVVAVLASLCGCVSAPDISKAAERIDSAAAHLEAGLKGFDPIGIKRLLDDLDAARRERDQLQREVDTLRAWESRTPTILTLHAPAAGLTFSVRVKNLDAKAETVITPGTTSFWKDHDEKTVPAFAPGPHESRCYFDLSDALRQGENEIYIKLDPAASANNQGSMASASLWYLRGGESVRAREINWNGQTPSEQKLTFFISPGLAQRKPE